MKKWLQVAGWTLLAMFVYYVLELLVGVIFRPLLTTATSREQYSRYFVWTNLAIKIMFLFVYGIWYRCQEGKWDFLPDYKGACRIKYIAGIVSIGMLGQYAVGMLVGIIRILAPDQMVEYEKITQMIQLEGKPTVLMLVLVGIIGPVAEELLFRGVIYGRLRDVFTMTQAIVISGAIFGIYHGNMIQGIYAWLYGMILAYVFEKTQTIWGSIVVHILFNLSAYAIGTAQKLLQLYSIQIPVIYYLLLEILSVVAVITALLVLRKRANRYDKIKELKLNLENKNELYVEKD